LTKPQFDVKVVNECKLAEMICAQLPLDILGIVAPRCCRRHCRLLGGGREGWLHVPLPDFGMDGNGNCNCNCLREKGVGQGRRREGIERWACFFMLSYFVIVFMAYPFQ
jgi:hypothetical protein